MRIDASQLVPMNTSRWRVLGGLIGVALLGVVLWRLVQYRQPLAIDWRSLSWPLLAAALACACAAQFAFASAWHGLVARGSADRWAPDMARWSVSLAGKYLPGKVFQAALRLGAYHGSPDAAGAAPAMLREMLLSLGAACAWVALQLAVSADGPQVLFWPVLAAAIGLTALAAPVFARLLARLVAHLSRGRIATGTPLAWPRIVLAWCLQLSGYLLFGVATWLLARAIAPTHPAGLLPCIGALCFGGLAGVAAFVVPAGIGVREAALAWYLSAWMAAGPAAMVAIAARLCLSLAEFAAIAIGLLLLRRERR